MFWIGWARRPAQSSSATVRGLRSFDLRSAGGGPSRGFELREPGDGMSARCAAHLGLRLQAGAAGGPLGTPEDCAAVIVAELRAAHACGFAVGHAGNRARDRGRDAARAAIGTARVIGHDGSGNGIHGYIGSWVMRQRIDATNRAASYAAKRNGARIVPALRYLSHAALLHKALERHALKLTALTRTKAAHGLARSAADEALFADPLSAAKRCW